MFRTFFKSEFYANHPSLQYVLNFNRELFPKFRNLLFLSLSTETTDLCVPFLIKREAFVMCNDGVWASFICVLALASVINRKIQLHYPDFGPEKYGLIFNSINFPRSYYESIELKSEESLDILYCNLSSSSNNHVKANHFVPLTKQKLSVKHKLTSSVIPQTLSKKMKTVNPSSKNIYHYFKTDAFLLRDQHLSLLPHLLKQLLPLPHWSHHLVLHLHPHTQYHH